LRDHVSPGSIPGLRGPPAHGLLTERSGGCGADVDSRRMTPADGTNDFDTAKTISELLKDLAADRQQRVLRWVAESIGLPSSPTVGPGPLQTPAHPGPLQGGDPTGRTVNIRMNRARQSGSVDMQFAAVVAYYYQFEAPIDQRLESVSAETLQEATRLANRARLTSPVQTLRNAKGQGYLDTVSRGQYRVNSVGENLVAMALPGTGTPTPTARTRSRTKKAGKPGKPKSSGRSPQKKVASNTARR